MALPMVSITKKGCLVFNASAARALFPRDFETQSVRIFVEASVCDGELVFAIRSSGTRYYPKDSTMSVSGKKTPSYVRSVYLRQATMTASGEKKRPAGGWSDIAPILEQNGILGIEIPYRPYDRRKGLCVLSLAKKEKKPCTVS